MQIWMEHDMSKIINWNAIIIHHFDAADDSVKSDWENVRRYHMSYRKNGEILDEKTAIDLIARGYKGIEKPMLDIGYHSGVELVDRKPTIKNGRPLDMVGGHCLGWNDRALGFCFGGDFDINPPTDEMLAAGSKVIAEWMHKFKEIGINRIYPHNAFSKKTCPGLAFPWDRFMRYVRIEYAGGFKYE